MYERDLSLDEFETLASEILVAHGALRFRARGDSMRPFLWNGDVLDVEAVPLGTIRNGDIVLCRPDQGGLLTHRVIRIFLDDGQQKLVIQGDALPRPDSTIALQQVLGRVVRVNHNGIRYSIDHPLMIVMVWLYLRLAPIFRKLYVFLHT